MVMIMVMAHSKEGKTHVPITVRRKVINVSQFSQWGEVKVSTQRCFYFSSGLRFLENSSSHEVLQKYLSHL